MYKYFDLLKNISNDIEKKGGKLYLVGGFVRDYLIKKENKDIDVEIHNINEKDLIKILSTYGEVITVGASFGVYIIKGIDIDFALPRTEKSLGNGHKDYSVKISPFIGLKQASLRRDFTINSLYYDISSDKVIDYFDGVNDLKEGIIKHVSSKTFIDDPLRVFRACQFSARFEFDIHPETIELCSHIDVSHLSEERVFMEFKKAVAKSSKPSIFFKQLKRMDKLSPFFEDLDKLKDDEFSCFLRKLDSLHTHDVFTVLCLIGLYTNHSFVKSITREKLYTIGIPHIVKSIQLLYKIDDIVSLRKLALSLSYKDIDVIDLLFEDKLKIIGLKCAKRFVSSKLVSSDDLFKLGIKPGKDFGLALKKAMELQILGMDKETILEKIIP